MPSLFAITVPNNSVPLNAQRRGSASFSVYDSSGRPVRGRAVLVPQGGATPDWFSIVGEAERDFVPSETVQYTVQVDIPSGAPPGEYSFQLDMVNVANPDEDYTRGPGVTIGVPESATPFRVPWWAYAVAGVVSVLAVVVAVILVIRPWDVERPEINSVRITPRLGQVEEGQELQLTARVLDIQGADLPGREVIWTSRNPEVAEVNPALGMVIGKAKGTAIIEATVEGVSDEMTVTVSQTPVKSIKLRIDSTNLVEGDQVKVQAMLLDKDENILENRSVVWSSNANEYATVTSVSKVDGLITAIYAGTSDSSKPFITATSDEGVSSSINLSVTHGPVESVQVRWPTSPFTVPLFFECLKVGSSVTMTAISKDKQGHTIGSSVTWTSGNDRILVVDPTGQATAKAEGTATVSAKSGGARGNLTVKIPCAGLVIGGVP
ncbi:MAG TPA: Ig-like domain-containing protein [Dehalococcoidia bacterium]|nr:Ig-like domain-containing protein [Dehalococcoidia bacterium]